MSYFKNYCKDCGIVIFGKGTRCTPCYKGFLRRWTEERIKLKQIIQQKDKHADKEVLDFFKKQGIKI